MLKVPWRTIISWFYTKTRLHGRRGKGTAEESCSRYKLRQAPQKEGRKILCDLPSSCVTPAGASTSLTDVQNKWDGNDTHTLYQEVKYCSWRRRRKHGRWQMKHGRHGGRHHGRRGYGGRHRRRRKRPFPALVPVLLFMPSTYKQPKRRGREGPGQQREGRCNEQGASRTLVY